MISLAISVDLWIKILIEPTNETGFKVKDWFVLDKETLDHLKET